ncbi:hypothetical protein [Ferdinandcohnia sp. Marseille-Q9671]
MVLGPRHNPFKKNHSTAVREFTDREEPRKAFRDAFLKKDMNQYKILTYYGVGGIGKTRLLEELFQQVNQLNPSALKALIDFKEEKFRLAGEGLIVLREELRKQQTIKFYSFDLAYSIYWKKLNPQVSMKNSRNDLPFIEEGSFIADLMEQLNYIPFAQWVPKTLKLIHTMGKYKDSFQWWHGRGKTVMEQLEGLQPSEIENMLPAFFAIDLKDYLEKVNSKIVLFIDTYEALWEKGRLHGSFYDKDTWVQELVLQLPEVLWVIAGREKIHWADSEREWELYLEQHLMGELSVKDSDRFLSSCGIYDATVKQIIIESSKGLPYYLDLMVDTYMLIQENEKRIPVPKDFSKTPEKILNRFLWYLDIREKETLRVLSFTRFWDEELFVTLLTEFKTGYPATAYMELFRFSFVNEIDDDIRKWTMNRIMATSLQEDVKKKNPTLYHRIHTFLFEYYNEKCIQVAEEKYSETDKLHIQEAFYHAPFVLTSEAYISWFLETVKWLQFSGQLEFVWSVRDDVFTKIADEKTIQAADVYQKFGEIGWMRGKYDQAIELLQKSINLTKMINTDLNPALRSRIMKSYADMGEIMVQATDYDKAFEYFSKSALHIQHTHNKNVQTLKLEAQLFTRLGKLNIRFSKYEESKANYQQAIKACMNALEMSSKDSDLFAIVAESNEKLGELYGRKQYELQGECYHKSINYYKKAIETRSLTNNIEVHTNMGLAYKRLAEHYSKQADPVKVIDCFEEAIKIYNDVLEQAPDYVDALEKKGHAAVDYMMFQIKIGQYDHALSTFTKAVDTFEKAIELSPKQGSSKNRVGSAHREIAKMYMKNNQKNEALAYLNKAEAIYKELLTESNYVYIHNSLGKTYETYGDIYTHFNEPDHAKTDYKLAIQEYKNMLKLAPQLREPLEGIERLEGKIGRL